MTELKLEYERKLAEYQQQHEHREGGFEPTPQPPILRSRREVRAKLYDMGLVRDTGDFGKIKRQRQKRSESQLEQLDGGIYRMKMGKVKPRRRRRGRDSSPEYVFNPEEHEVRSFVLIALWPASICGNFAYFLNLLVLHDVVASFFCGFVMVIVEAFTTVEH